METQNFKEEFAKGTQFSGVNQPANNTGRPKGSKNKATLFKEFLAIKTPCTDVEGKETNLTLEQQMLIAAFKKAKAGDMSAFKEMMRGRYGKDPDAVTIETTEEKEVCRLDYSRLNLEELDALEVLYRKASVMVRIHED